MFVKHSPTNFILARSPHKSTWTQESHETYHPNCHFTKEPQKLIFPGDLPLRHRGQNKDPAALSKHTESTVQLRLAFHQPSYSSLIPKNIRRSGLSCLLDGRTRQKHNLHRQSGSSREGEQKSVRCCKTHLDSSPSGMDVGWNGSRRRWGWRWGNRASRNMIQHPTQEKKSPSWAR